jgi:hypothetical protein
MAGACGLAPLLVWLVLRDMEVTRLAGIIVGIILLTAVQVETLRRRTEIAVPATAVIIAALNIVGLFGFLFYRALAAQAQVSAALPQTDEVYEAAAKVFLTASISVWLGGLAAGRSQHNSGSRVPAREVLRSISPAGALGTGLLPLMLNVVGFSPSGLIHRANYLTAEGITACVSFGSLLTPIGLAVLSFTLFDLRRPFSLRAYAALLLGVHIVVLFAVGTRQFCLLPGILLLAWTQNRATVGGRLPRSLLLATAGATLILIQLPLNLRGDRDGAGLAPFSHTLLTQPEIIFAIHPGAVFGNILFSFPLAGTILVLRGGTLPLHGFFTSINPLPSQFTDWAQVFPTLGLNSSTPFSGLGELAAHGSTFVTAYMFTVALILGLLQRSVATLTPSAATIGSLAVLGVSVIFTFDALQYNLRSGLRPVWYLIVIIAVLNIVARQPRSRTR